MTISLKAVNDFLDHFMARMLRAEFQANIAETRLEYASFTKIMLLSIPLLFGFNLLFITASPADWVLYLQLSYTFALGLLFHLIPTRLPLWFMLIHPPVFLVIITITLSILYVKYLAYPNFIVPIIFLVSFYFYSTRFSIALMLVTFSVLAVVFYNKHFDDSLILWNLYFGSSLITGLAMYRVVCRILRTSQSDAMTGLYNRGFAEKNLTAQVNLSHRNSAPLSLVYIDVDNFKSINDNLGHLEGDKVLRDIADSIRLVSRKSDIASRWGGDEFVIILPQTDARKARKLIDRLLHKQKQYEISCGVVELQKHETVDQLLTRADQTMYEVKNHKKRQDRSTEGES